MHILFSISFIERSCISGYTIPKKKKISTLNDWSLTTMPNINIGQPHFSNSTLKFPEIGFRYLTQEFGLRGTHHVIQQMTLI